MNIPPECFNIIEKSLIETGFIGQVSPENAEDLAAHYLDVKRLDEQINLLETYTDIKGKFLEVGSGFGGLVTYLNKRCDAFGVEPSADAYAGTMACTKVLASENEISNKFIAAQGEALPFPENTFDIVYSTSVLEHVKYPDKVIEESIRVLKKGGILQFVIPNYGSFWEGHYGVLMLPYMPKWLFKLYVKMYGRAPEFIDTLQFINRRQLQKILEHSMHKVELLSWGEDIWERRVRSLAFSEWASLGKLMVWVRLLHKFKLVDMIVYLGKKLHWETPFILTVRKK